MEESANKVLECVKAYQFKMFIKIFFSSDKYCHSSSLKYKIEKNKTLSVYIC